MPHGKFNHVISHILHYYSMNVRKCLTFEF